MVLLGKEKYEKYLFLFIAMLKIIKENRFLFLILFLLSLGSFLVYSHLYFTSNFIFDSPDEIANFVFIKEFAQNSNLFLESNYSAYSNIEAYPRSTLFINNKIVPISFLGIILILGIIAKVIGVSFTVWVFIPLLSVRSQWFYSGFQARY